MEQLMSTNESLTFHISQYDRNRAIRYKALPHFKGDDVSTVYFSMKNAAGAVVIDNAAAIIIDQSPFECEYEWGAGTTDTAGTFEGQFTCKLTDGSTLRLPTRLHITIVITESVNPSNPA